MEDCYIQRRRDGRFEGEVSIEGIDLSPIDGMFYKQDGKMFLYLKRRPVLEYDAETMSYKQRESMPYWSAQLEKQGDGVCAYRGEFMFLRLRFSIVGIWDKIMGQDKQRLNLYVERLPIQQQNIINLYNKGRNG